eukprot:6499557-Prymnesium_polylepis.1
MPVTGSHDLSHGTPLLVPHHSTSACNRPPLRLTSQTRTASYAISSGAALLAMRVRWPPGRPAAPDTMRRKSPPSRASTPPQARA